MKTDFFFKLVKLDNELTILESRGKAIRQPFNAMMKRQQEHYSLLLTMKNNPSVNKEQLKKEIKELDKFLEFYSLSLTSWDFSIDQRNEFYQQWSLRDVLSIEDKQKRQGFLNCFADMKETFLNILQTMENLIAIQREIIFRLEGSVHTAEEVRINTDPMLNNLN